MYAKKRYDKNMEHTRHENLPPRDPRGMLTIPEAARTLQVAERTLRRVLAEPMLQARLVERVRKVGIYHKCVPLLPPDLLTEVAVRLHRRGGTPRSHPNKAPIMGE